MEKPAVNYQEYIAGLIARARKAQAVAEGHDQARVNELTAAIAWSACNEDFCKKAAEMLVEESKIGVVADKAAKIRAKAVGTYRDMKDEISVGIVETNTELGLVKYVKPMGVLGALIPITNGEATPFVKALWALKTRNAIIMAPHPNGRKTCRFIVDYMRDILKKYDAPEDLIIAIDPEHIAIESTNQLMKQVDFIVATGGTPMVRVAYSSGTPVIGVGTGNVATYIDSTADLDDAADKICRSKIFDNSSSCSSENSLVIDQTIYDKFLVALEKAGALIVREGTHEHGKLQTALWPNWPADHNINRNIVGKVASRIAEIAGIDMAADKKFIAVEENGGVGHSHPFTGEKLSPVTTLIKVKNFDDGLDKMEAILEYQGKGHSCGIHTDDDDKINKLALRMKVSRILVNQPHCLGNSGAFFNGMPFTMSLGCGTWGYNSTCNNVTWKDVVNFTLVSKPFEPNAPDLNMLFPEAIRSKR